MPSKTDGIFWKKISTSHVADFPYAESQSSAAGYKAQMKTSVLKAGLRMPLIPEHLLRHRQA